MKLLTFILLCLIIIALGACRIIYEENKAFKKKNYGNNT